MPLTARRRTPLPWLLLLLCGLAPSGCTAPHPYKGYNVVLISIETTRSDFLGCYGSELNCSPRLDSLAARGTLVRECYTVAPWTRPSIASLWTGLAPGRHTATTNTLDARLPSGALTIAELLSASGYRTFGYVTNSNLAPALGFSQGFRDYVYKQGANANTVNEAALQWMGALAAAKDSTPVFIALHLDEPHSAYFQAHLDKRLGAKTRPEIIRACTTLDDVDRVWATELYRRRIEDVDAAIGDFVDRTIQVLGKRTVFVITADHGEEWLDHGGLFHGWTLHRELLSVPLIIYVPDQKAAVVSGPVRSYDIFPTLCEWIGVRCPKGLEGRSVARALRTGNGFPNEVISESSFAGESLLAIQRGSLKLIHDSLRDEVALFDLHLDAGEQADCAPKRPKELLALEERLEKHRKHLASHALIVTSADSAALSAEDRKELEEQLHAIGYVAGREGDDEKLEHGLRSSWKDVRSGFRFVPPEDPAIRYRSTTMRPASVRPRVILGHRRGDRCRATLSFQRAYVLLDCHSWSGFGEIRVDGTRWARLDLFNTAADSTFRAVPIEFEEWGEHVVEIVVLGKKRAASRSCEVLFNGIVIELPEERVLTNNLAEDDPASPAVRSSSTMLDDAGALF